MKSQYRRIACGSAGLGSACSLTLGPANGSKFSAFSSSAEELIAAVGLESRNKRSMRHLEALQDLPRSRIDPPQFALLAFPRTILNQDGNHVVATFFAPFEREVEPLIRMSTGDYPALKRLKGRDDALAPFIIALSHEIVHYFQWIEGGEPAVSERGVNAKAPSMLSRYATEVKRP